MGFEMTDFLYKKRNGEKFNGGRRKGMHQIVNMEFVLNDLSNGKPKPEEGASYAFTV